MSLDWLTSGRIPGNAINCTIFLVRTLFRYSIDLHKGSTDSVSYAQKPMNIGCQWKCSVQSKNRYNSGIVLRKVGILTVSANSGIVPDNSIHLMTKPTKCHVRPAKTQISLGIRLAWSVFAVRIKKARSLATHWAHSEDSDQTGRMPRLIWVFAGRTVILSVLSWDGSN